MNGNQQLGQPPGQPLLFPPAPVVEESDLRLKAFQIACGIAKSGPQDCALVALELGDFLVEAMPNFGRRLDVATIVFSRWGMQMTAQQYMQTVRAMTVGVVEDTPETKVRN